MCQRCHDEPAKPTVRDGPFVARDEASGKGGHVRKSLPLQARQTDMWRHSAVGARLILRQFGVVVCAAERELESGNRNGVDIQFEAVDMSTARVAFEGVRTRR